MHCTAGPETAGAADLRNPPVAYLKYCLVFCRQLWKLPVQVMSVLEKVGLVLLIELVPVRSCVQVQLT